MCWPGSRDATVNPAPRPVGAGGGARTRKDTRQKGPVLCYDESAALTPERVLAEIKSQAARRPDGLMTSDQLCRALGAHPLDLDAVLRGLERAGAIVAAP